MKLSNLKNSGSNNKNMRDAEGMFIHFTGKKTIAKDAETAGFECSQEYLDAVEKIWTFFAATSYIYAAGEILKIKSNVKASTIHDEDTDLNIVICPYFFINVTNGKVEKFWDADIVTDGVDKNDARLAGLKPSVDAFNLKYGIKTEDYKAATVAAQSKKTSDAVKLKKFYDFSKSNLDAAITEGCNLLQEVNDKLADTGKGKDKGKGKKSA